MKTLSSTTLATSFTRVLRILPALTLFSLTIPAKEARAGVCPAIGDDTDCGVVITVSDKGASTTTTGQGPYDGGDDTLVGVVNNSTQPIQGLSLTGDTDIFDFDGDGVSESYYGAPGNAEDTSQYGGPNAYFTNISPDTSEGKVNFINPIAPGGTGYFSLEESLTSAISCQQIVNNSVTPQAYGPQINASFTPSNGSSLKQAAKDCGFKGFDWIQKVTRLPDPSPFYQNNPSNPNSPIHLTSHSAPFNDPPPNGYTYENGIDNSNPFYYDPNNGELDAHDNYGYGYTLLFRDAPADPCLPGSSPNSYCGRLNTHTGNSLAFTTHLAGILPNGSAQDLGIGFSWMSNFNGTSGGIATTKNDGAVDPGSGTGGVTITGETNTTTYQYTTQAITVNSVSNAVTVPEPYDSVWPLGILLLFLTRKSTKHDTN